MTMSLKGICEAFLRTFAGGYDPLDNITRLHFFYLFDLLKTNARQDVQRIVKQRKQLGMMQTKTNN